MSDHQYRLHNPLIVRLHRPCGLRCISSTNTQPASSSAEIRYSPCIPPMGSTELPPTRRPVMKTRLAINGHEVSSSQMTEHGVISSTRLGVTQPIHQVVCLHWFVTRRGVTRVTWGDTELINIGRQSMTGESLLIAEFFCRQRLIRLLSIAAGPGCQNEVYD